MKNGDREWLEQRALNVIGHELRTPASTVRGLSEVFAAGVDPTERPDLADALVRNARRLEGLVDDLLTATAVWPALPVGDASRVDIVNQVVLLWPDDDGLAIDGAGSARARPTSLARIVGAVLDNARTYGKRPVTVSVAARGGRVLTSFDSPGPVLPAEDVRLALEPFWRGERAVTSSPGLGLGLTVARVLADHEGGRLWVEGRRGGGMLTHLELPAA
ncbi:MAG TPA: HAMP domain-containing sensor histidine kinase [Acidimicrobiales bacterium]|nr:HAMP domain-containing sensor histidine kinase [Acidimicrobiales bacterium]